MEDSNSWRIRVHHAIRCAIGGSSIAAIGLTTAATPGCVPSILFFISTIAGTPENLQGFQLRSASFTFLGAMLGAILYTIIAAMATTSKIATFFAAVPFIAFLSALRADKDLTPMPAVANVYMGFLLISQVGTPRRELGKDLAQFIIEASIAWAVANMVNLIIPPHRAGSIGRKIVAHELRRMGAIISTVGTRTFSKGYSELGKHPFSANSKMSERGQSRQDFAVFLQEGIEQHAANAGLLGEDYIFLTENLPARRLTNGLSLIRSCEMIETAERSLHYMKDLLPFGQTRVSDYASLARASKLFEASAYEPQLYPEAANRWRNIRSWKKVIENMYAVVNKVSSLESIARMGEKGGEIVFSEELMHGFFGEAYLPLWTSHFASLAASCAKMSSVMCRATCDEMFSLSATSDGGTSDEKEGQDEVNNSLDWAIDPRRWNARRADMYFGFLLRYRLALRSITREGLPNATTEKDSDSPRPSHDKFTLFRRSSRDGRPSIDLKSHPMRRSASVIDVESVVNCPKNLDSEAIEAQTGVKSKAEVQALSYFAITSHALSEEIGHVQQAMTELASTSDARGFLAPFHFLVSGVPPLWNRLKALATLKLQTWEVRFLFTHTLLLASILALSLFLPISISDNDESELAWIYTSAALAAQLSAEPTLFIGAIRVVATLTGAGTAFAFTSLLNAFGRSENPKLQYLVIPYMFVICVTCLLLVPPTYRYAAFLITVTNALILFCPRTTAECSHVLEEQDEECFPNWRYALTRSVCVSLGVVFAVFFHLIFWPRFANQVALRYLSDVALNGSRLFGKLHRTYFLYGLPGASESPKSEHIPQQSQDKRQELVFDEDVYQKDQPVLDEVVEKVGKPMAEAMLLTKSEAGVWQTGPFRLYPLIPRILSDFAALTVSLVEMASILGRRPIFSSSYGRSVFEHYIRPMLDIYETIQISLLNLVGITNRTVHDNDEAAIQENTFDLHHAITHLARIRGKLRQDAEKRFFEFKKFSALSLAHRKSCGLTHHRSATDDSYVDLVSQDLSFSKKSSDVAYPRARSNNEMNRPGLQGSHNARSLCVDDVVLYDAFTFITDTCLSAFVRISVAVLIDSESKLEHLKQKRMQEKGILAKVRDKFRF